MRQHKPAWWQLYALIPVMVGLILIERWDPFPGVAPEIVDLGVVVLAFGAMLAWMRLNSGVIEYDEMQRDHTFQHLRISMYDPQADVLLDVGNSNLWSPARLAEQANSPAAPQQGKHEEIELWSRN